MAEIGSSLRAAREAQGLSLAAVEAATRIRMRFLRALEEDRFDALPSGAYGRVFLREYARFLELDPEPLVAALPRQELGISPRPEPPPFGPLRWRRPAAGLAALALGIGLAVWLATPEHHRPGPAPAAAAPVHRVTKHAAASARPHRAALPSVAVLRATRGDCWILVRRGDSVVWQGLLTAGRSLRLPVRQRLWIRLGAPWNVDVALGRRTLAPPLHAPGNLWLSGSGLAPA